MNVKGRKTKNQANINNSMNVLSPEELGRRIAAVETDLKASTWKDLEVGGKFDSRENHKTTFGQILDLLDKNRESEDEVRLMDGTEVSIYGPINSPHWKTFEDRTINNLAIEDGVLEVWLEGD